MRLREIGPDVRAAVLKKLRAEWSLARKVGRMNIPVAGSFMVSDRSVWFYPKDKADSRKLALAVGKMLGVNGWKRVFSTWDGSWDYKTTVQLSGRINRKVELAVAHAPQPENCRVVRKTELVTKYESICNGDREES